MLGSEPRRTSVSPRPLLSGTETKIGGAGPNAGVCVWVCGWVWVWGVLGSGRGGGSGAGRRSSRSRGPGRSAREAARAIQRLVARARVPPRTAGPRVGQRRPRTPALGGSRERPAWPAPRAAAPARMAPPGRLPPEASAARVYDAVRAYEQCIVLSDSGETYPKVRGAH